MWRQQEGTNTGWKGWDVSLLRQPASAFFLLQSPRQPELIATWGRQRPSPAGLHKLLCCLMSSDVDWHITYQGQAETSAWAWFSTALCPQKPSGLLGWKAQDGHLDFHTAPELCFMSTKTIRLVRMESPGWPPWLSHSSWALSHKQAVLHLMRQAVSSVSFAHSCSDCSVKS